MPTIFFDFKIMFLLKNNQGLFGMLLMEKINILRPKTAIMQVLFFLHKIWCDFFV